MGSNYIVGIRKARNFKFGVLTDIEESAY